VGKSTLFNRIVGERKAVVSDIAGTTRDRIVAETEWNDRSFLVVDTGGIEVRPPTVDAGRRSLEGEALMEDSEAFIPLIRQQAEVAVDEADLIVFLTDATVGLTGADLAVADLLRRSEKPVLVVANKAENEAREMAAYEFYELGMGEVLAVSAIHGSGIGDMLDVSVDQLPEDTEPETRDDDTVRIAIIGRPNVGKSSLLNRLLGHERAIVSPVAGTTRDAVDTELVWEGQRIVLVDTAGIRRRGKIDAGVEKYSVLRTSRALKRADLALLLIDATEGITAQDTHIAGMTVAEGVSVVVLVNKWDAIESELRQRRQDLEDHIREELQFLNYIPLHFISALTGMNVNQILPASREVVEARYQRIPAGPLNDTVQQALIRHSPPSVGGRRLRIYFATQAEVAPPRFTFHVNDPELVHFSYQRYLENAIRGIYPFAGTPITMMFKGREPRAK